MPNALAVRAAAASSLARVQEILDGFAARDTSGEILTAVRHIPAREAQWAAMPEWIHPNLAAAYQAIGRGGRSCARRTQPCCGHANRLGQDGLLQPAGCKRDS